MRAVVGLNPGQGRHVSGQATVWGARPPTPNRAWLKPTGAQL